MKTVGVHVIGGLIGLTLGFVVLGPELILGHRAEVLSATGDGAVGLAGFRYFVADTWQFPVLKTTRLAHPDGIAIVYTDSIPLLALVAKLARPLGVAAETWWGAWFGAVFVGQAVATVFTLRAWRVTSVVVQWLGAALLCLFPAMLLRIFHPALMFQAPLILALGLVAVMRTPAPTRPTVARFHGATQAMALVPVVALLIHPYHAVVVLLVIGCGLVDAVRHGARTVAFAARTLAAATACTGVVLVTFGYVGGMEAPGEGYGVYALIPYSFFRPQRSWIWPGTDEILLTGGAFEGFVFLGVGAVVLVTVAAVLAWPHRRRLVAGNAALLIGFVFLAAYAVTPRVHLDPDDPIDLGAFALRYVSTPDQVIRLTAATVLALSVAGLVGLVRRHSWPVLWRQRLGRPSTIVLFAFGSVALVALASPGLLHTLTGTFRASGRLAWILGYAMVIGSIVMLSRRLSSRTVALILVVVLAVQFVDQQQLRRFAHDLHHADHDRAAHLDAMAAMASGHDLVHLVPDYVCVPFGPQLDEYIDVVSAASIAAVPIDNTYAARQSYTDCDGHPADPSTVAIDLGPAVLHVGVGRIPPGFSAEECVRWSANVIACADPTVKSPPEVMGFFAGAG